MTRRPPRRTLRRQARLLPQHLLAAAIAAELEHVRAAVAQATRRRGGGVDIGAVLEMAWLAFGTSPWCVADLRTAQAIAEHEGPAAGAALRELLDTGGRWGRLQLAQVSGKTSRDGRIWHLRRL